MARKTLTERIADHVAKKKPNRRAKNLAAFLANKLEIQAAIDDGWSVKVIWETLVEEKRISVSYQAFNSYVNKHIRGKAEKPSQEPVDAKPSVATKETKQSPSKGFVFDSKPNQEDLI